MKNPRTLKDFENDPRVSSIHQETHDQTDYWIYLNWPYNCEVMDCPSIHEHTLKDCSDVFKSVVLDYEYWIFDTFIPEKPKHLDIKETYQLTLDDYEKQIEYKNKMHDYKKFVSKSINECLKHARSKKDQKSINRLFSLGRELSANDRFRPNREWIAKHS
ncbi:hypothetical protein [uncultured Mediterranean phage uvMED]|nr:hypothetical protein [uncultured Mediterranean phage uvMED]BAR21930.1 hypothetical protein [uncultured Mediterranean phage uvMED]BAR21953.1 hypothetical protein [uncultured Mediterranean phage uvMED]BAR38676.1 hypothetical protein [uncultured Mediterranean phage uvMED]BAR38862.1 hypothetical protein [uncultured Mediterranean phage uvMED]